MAFDISTMLNDPNGSLSSKRVVTVAAAVLMLISYVVSWFQSIHGMVITVSPDLFKTMMYLVAAGTGFSSLDHFAPFHPTPDPATQ